MINFSHATNAMLSPAQLQERQTTRLINDLENNRIGQQLSIVLDTNPPDLKVAIQFHSYSAGAWYTTVITVDQEDSENNISRHVRSCMRQGSRVYDV